MISDVFSRLGFMERRGSGIDRILNSYVEVAQKPTFYSDSDFFIVTLPNRSVATPAQISMESVASGAESTETSAESAETSTFQEISVSISVPQHKRCTAIWRSEISCILYHQESYQAWIGDVTRIWRIPICEEVTPLSTGGF